MSMFDGLKEAIRDVLVDATYCNGAHAVNSNLLRILQAEYNIHFVEPEDEQLDVLS